MKPINFFAAILSFFITLWIYNWLNTPKITTKPAQTNSKYCLLDLHNDVDMVVDPLI